MTFGVDGYDGPRAAARGCPDPAVIMALSGDALPDDLRAPAERHLQGCPACQALAADLRELEAELPVPASLETRVLGPSRPAWWKMTLPLAAVLVVAVAAAFWANARRNAPATTTARVEPSAPPVERAGRWTVEKPAVLLPLATALVVRGDEDPAASALLAALAPYRQDDFPAAAAALEQVAKAHPASGDAWFYLGASRLLSGDPAAAREALLSAERHGVAERGDEVQWLLATAEARAGDVASARTRLDRLCERENPFRTPACEAAGTLP